MRARNTRWCATALIDDDKKLGQSNDFAVFVLVDRFIKELDGGVAEKAQLGLGHSYSRAKVKTS